MKNGKAVGSDKVFAECMNIEKRLMGTLIMEIWKASGRVGEMPSAWHDVKLYPIYKKGDRKAPEHYRSISLLSHMRKSVDKVIDAEIRNITDFHSLQYGFKKGRGVEHALLRFSDASR